MELSNLKPAEGSVKSRKRIARGEGSGRGGTSTRGHNGAKSRSGYSKKIGFEGGQMPLQKRIPKYGFFSRKKRFTEELRLSSLIALNEEKVNLEILKEKDLINQNTKKVKVIKDTESCPKLILNGIHVTSSVKGLIENSGGKIEI